MSKKASWYEVVKLRKISKDNKEESLKERFTNLREARIRANILHRANNFKDFYTAKGTKLTL
jgi:hypothetical protein